ncbi:MAG: hypothetical protein JXB62_01105 [Pirellulales bacterium]|nr:hypothetical protein [Pirellulales bacterium]
MKTWARLSMIVLLGTSGTTGLGGDGLPPIRQVEIRPGRAFEVNGRPFFPLMAWLQDAKNFPLVEQCGMNTVAGYHPGSSDTKSVGEYLTLVEQAGFYGVMPYDPALKDRHSLLGYIHDDEPDMPRQVSDAEVVPAKHLRPNPSTPLWRIVDGVWHSWSVLDPLEGASVTIRPKQPVTIETVGVWVTASEGLAVAKEVSLAADGQEILKATLEAKREEQKFSLSKPATLASLTITVESTHPGQHVWGSIGEIAGYDAAGKNVLCSPPRYEPRTTPEETLRKYRAMKAAAPLRPVFMTLTGYFHPRFGKWSEAQRDHLYPAYLRATDVVGYDIYPIYGWNKPEWLYLVHDATEQLVGMAKDRPVYAWIETSKGGQWTGPLERQQDVTPAHIRAEVWMAVCRGATAIGYFTHVWKPSYHQFGVPEQNRAALREINGQITRLAPAILGELPGQPIRIASPDDVKLDALARRHEGKLYVFAVNYDERARPTAATIELPGLAAGTPIDVLDESRAIRSAAGRWTDSFEPLAVHIYCVEFPD